MSKRTVVDQPDRPFYVGYHPEIPSALRAWLRRLVLLGGVVAIGLAWILARSHHDLPNTIYEFGAPTIQRGRLRTAPYPMLTVQDTISGGTTHFHLVSPGKYGAQAQVAGRDGQIVRLQGALIARRNQMMLELVLGTIVPTEGSGRRMNPPPVEDLGRQTLVGEIVDGKCFLGAMNPGAMQTHRGCAIRCLMGGILPMFTVRGPAGAERELILVDPAGGPASQDILMLAGLPIRLTGRLQREGDLFFFRADPMTYERIH